jgi:hypothetical protein
MVLFFEFFEFFVVKHLGGDLAMVYRAIAVVILAGMAVPGAVAHEGVAPVMIEETTEAGAIGVAPATAVAGTFGTWTVTYTVGSGGIAPGGGMRVQMPDDFHAGPRNSANRLQSSDPGSDHFVSATCSREDVQVEAEVEHPGEHELVKHAKPSLDGRFERYVFVVRVRVVQRALEEGDTLSVIYGDTSHGSRGYRAGDVSTPPLPVLVAVDADGSGRFRLHSGSPTIQIHGGPAATLLLHAPSQAVVGKPMRILLAAVDKEDNPAGAALTGRITGADDLGAPEAVEIPAGRGYVAFEVTPRTTGVLRLTARAADGRLSATSNPVVVQDDAPDEVLLWGELHSHSHFSWDGVGHDQFDYARYVAGLDFYAMTDHAMEPQEQGTRGLHEGNWEEYAAQVEAHHAPPAFVTLHAYECSFGTPWGHHNVFFRDKPGALAYPQTASLPELWKMLEAGNALTIPHHTGKFPSGVIFTPHDPELRRNFEIYSGHGLSEVYDPDHPLAFEHSDFTSPATSAKNPSFAQDVWMQGLLLSTVAASDDHRAQPGKPFYGLTAVRAPENTRDAVFQALYDRRTYGTTGSKIILDFSLNGEPMGAVVDVDGVPELRVEAIGTDTIGAVELLRYRPEDEGFEIIQSWTPNAMEFDQTYRDDEYTPGSIYYTRLRQTNEIGGRIVMAWSSPIWTGGG